MNMLFLTSHLPSFLVNIHREIDMLMSVLISDNICVVILKIWNICVKYWQPNIYCVHIYLHTAVD